MHGTLPRPKLRAISTSAAVCHQRQEFAEPLWFAVMCRDLWGQNAPKELEFKTGRSDRTCRAWTSGDSPPPVNIFLMLLSNPECGHKILNYTFRDNDTEWGRELRAALAVLAEFHIERR